MHLSNSCASSVNSEVILLVHHSCLIIALQGDRVPPLVLVDGYNVLYKIKAFMQLNNPAQPVHQANSFAEIRDELERSLQVYSNLRDVRLVIVYDAIYRPADPVYLGIRTTTRYKQYIMQ